MIGHFVCQMENISLLSPPTPLQMFDYATVKLCSLQKFNRFTIAQLYVLRQQQLVDGVLGKRDFL